MTAPHSLPFAAMLEENLASASPDPLRQMVKTFAEAMMSADAYRACGGEYGRPSEGRINHRNGYRHRSWDTPPAFGRGHPQRRHRRPGRPQAPLWLLLPLLAARNAGTVPSRT